METTTPTNPSEVDQQNYKLQASSALPLPEGCVPVTLDGAVLKRTVLPGHGDRPSLHARCYATSLDLEVHYTGRLMATGEVFMDTQTDSENHQPIQLVAGRNTSATLTGLHLAVATMNTGEKCELYILDPKYGYGDRGNFSFPSVPPRSQLMYELQLLDWEAREDGAENEENTGGLLYEERLERAERLRLQGNSLFQESKHTDALTKYAVALSLLDEDFMFQLEGSYLDKAEAVKIPIHLNMAACQIKLEDYHTAIYNCTQVLKMDNQQNNAKALFRRGRARHLLGQTEEALEDLQAAHKQCPDDKGISKELHELRKTIKQEHAATARMFKGQFKPSPEPVQQPAESVMEPQAAVAAASDSIANTPAGIPGLLGRILRNVRQWLMQVLGKAAG